VDDDYDDSPWTREELEALAWELVKDAGWDDMTEYDDIPDESANAPSSWRLHP
jgi:hypothetical protein